MIAKYNDQLEKVIETCLIHKKRLHFALEKLSHLLPLTEELYYTLTDEEMAYIDQYIFRFAKYQDLIGSKLFKQILLTEGELSENLSFRDVFEKAEKLGIAEDWEKWFGLRQIRNEISHEYPVISDEAVESLNKIFDSLDYLETIFSKCISFLNSRHRINGIKI